MNKHDENKRSRGWRFGLVAVFGLVGVGLVAGQIRGRAVGAEGMENGCAGPGGVVMEDEVVEITEDPTDAPMISTAARTNVVYVPREVSTLQEAVDLIEVEGTVVIGAGIYSGPVRIEGKTVHLIGEQAEAMMLAEMPEVPDPDELSEAIEAPPAEHSVVIVASDGPAVTFAAKSAGTIADVRFEGVGVGIHGDGVARKRAGRVIVRNVAFNGMTTAIRGTFDHLETRGVRITGASGDGIALSNVPLARLEELEITDGGDVGIRIENRYVVAESCTVKILGSRIERNAAEGVIIRGPRCEAITDGVYLAENGGAGVTFWEVASGLATNVTAVGSESESHAGLAVRSALVDVRGSSFMRSKVAMLDAKAKIVLSDDTTCGPVEGEQTACAIVDATHEAPEEMEAMPSKETLGSMKEMPSEAEMAPKGEMPPKEERPPEDVPATGEMPQ